MDRERTDTCRIEERLLELNDAVRAGVFRRTNIEARTLLHRRVVRSAWRSAFRVGCTAAVVVAAVGLFIWVPRMGPGGAPSATSGTLASAPTMPGGAFHECFGGPTDVGSSPCHAHDYDADGDVDLADFGTYQVTYAGTDY